MIAENGSNPSRAAGSGIGSRRICSIARSIKVRQRSEHDRRGIPGSGVLDDDSGPALALDGDGADLRAVDGVLAHHEPAKGKAIRVHGDVE